MLNLQKFFFFFFSNCWFFPPSPNPLILFSPHRGEGMLNFIQAWFYIITYFLVTKNLTLHRSFTHCILMRVFILCQFMLISTFSIHAKICLYKILSLSQGIYSYCFSHTCFFLNNDDNEIFQLNTFQNTWNSHVWRQQLVAEL